MHGISGGGNALAAWPTIATRNLATQCTGGRTRSGWCRFADLSAGGNAANPEARTPRELPAGFPMRIQIPSGRALLTLRQQIL
jgi:hypothetical protein